ncbi:hypothetical protein F4604DRAFT_1175658 [Suillus subluteus]|nr:hypothetical protein F4604DRAFT_1175658 [Suillus subluteus]
MLAMIAILISVSSMLRWIHTDLQQTQKVSFILALSLTPTDGRSATQARRLLRRILPIVNSHSHVLRSLVPALFRIW